MSPLEPYENYESEGFRDDWLRDPWATGERFYDDDEEPIEEDDCCRCVCCCCERAQWGRP